MINNLIFTGEFLNQYVTQCANQRIFTRRLINRTIDKREIHKDLKFVSDISSCGHFSDIIDEKRIQPCDY